MADLWTLKGCYSIKRQIIWLKFCKALVARCALSYYQKLNKFGLFILILGRFAIMDQTACCYNMTTSEKGLFPTIVDYHAIAHCATFLVLLLSMQSISCFTFVDAVHSWDWNFLIDKSPLASKYVGRREERKGFIFVHTHLKNCYKFNGPISNFVLHCLFFLKCTKFHIFFTKCSKLSILVISLLY